ncbi:MAG: hypothetical protein CBE00_00495 [Planctomycetaceae bacterium TMED240]|nr:hypothetical protein [Rhodopirellula sp.]OUX08951.1 MAG: hypothetical protein CBE00_00495 [Planctomycetaceae bacterium TMED240]
MNKMDVNPDWAWEAYEPSITAPWDLGAVAHLFRRGGFGAPRDQLLESVESEPAKVVEALVGAEEPEVFRQEMQSLLRAALATGNVRQLAAQWAYRMLHTPAPLKEKMTLFWHGHFATSDEKVGDVRLMQAQNDLLRKYALGDFQALTLEISRDPAMLLYLDSATNRKSHPNENYAREIMELFCLGEGVYTEQDVQELARCFTGWEIKQERYRFNRYQHDSGKKTVLGVAGLESGEEAIRVVTEHPAVPRFLVRKLFQFFVMDEPEPTEELLEPLVKQLSGDQMNIGPTLKRILGSNLFFSPLARARKVRSPVEIGVGFLRAFEGTTDFYQLADAMYQLGQGLYQPPSVKGWDGGRAWINSSTLLGRANLIHRMLNGSKTRFGKQPLASYFETNGVESIEEIAEMLEVSLFAVRIPKPAIDRVKALAAASEDARRVNLAVHAFCTLPEFQVA